MCQSSVLSVLWLQPQPPPPPCHCHPPCTRAFVTLWLTFRYAVNANPARCSLPPVTSLLPQLTFHPAPPLSCCCSCDISLTRPLACLISAIVHNFYCACCELVSVTPDEHSPLPSPTPPPLPLPMLHCCNFLQFKISAIIDLGHLHLGVASFPYTKALTAVAVAVTATTTTITEQL